MILDRLTNAATYLSLHRDFAAAFAFLQQSDLASLPAGRHAIDGERVYAIVDRPTGKGRAAARLEAHRKYIDIQLCLRGLEQIGWRALSECRQVTESYDAQRDIEFFADPSETWLALPEGTFAIFFPHDAHAPLAGEGEVLKVVVKIAVA